MLYYYITVLPKKQALFRIFFNPLKNGLFLPPDLWKNTAVPKKHGGSGTGTAALCLFQITAAPEHRPDMYLHMRRTRGMHLRR